VLALLNGTVSVTLQYYLLLWTNENENEMSVRSYY